jgi:hypothetical protein
MCKGVKKSTKVSLSSFNILYCSQQLQKKVDARNENGHL